MSFSESIGMSKEELQGDLNKIRAKLFDEFDHISEREEIETPLGKALAVKTNKTKSLEYALEAMGIIPTSENMKIMALGDIISGVIEEVAKAHEIGLDKTEFINKIK